MCTASLWHSCLFSCIWLANHTSILLLLVCCRRKVENLQDVHLRSKFVCKHPFLHRSHTVYLQNTISHPTLRTHTAPALTSLGNFPCTLVLSEGTLQIGMQTPFSHTQRTSRSSFFVFCEQFTRFDLCCVLQITHSISFAVFRPKVKIHSHSCAL